MMIKERQKIDREFKQKAVELSFARGNAKEIAEELGIRSDNWKYFRYRFLDAPEELYNLEDDPMETNNLAADPAYNLLLHNFRNELEYQTRKYKGAKLVSDFTDPRYIRKNY